VTSDHVPPKCLFPPETRVNLVTVEACAPCHESFKLDDEYFLVALSVRADLPDSPGTEFLRAKTKRTLRNPSAKHFSAAIRKATTQIPIHSEGGIYLGEATALKLQPRRIIATAERIIKGLYAEHFARVLPSSHEVIIELLDLQKDNSALQRPEIKELLVSLGEHGTHQRFGNILELWFAGINDDADSSYWFVQLHGAFGFLAFTLPRDRPALPSNELPT
jgi:hypothetical protein